MAKGKKVGRYELGKTLGSGSFSKVKLGTDEQGNQYAIKIVDKEQLTRERMEEQLKREIAIMRMLAHPNIVRLHDVLQTANNIYLVLELVTGGELFDRIVSAKKFDEDTGRRFFQQLVVALHYCHRQGVAHRDLKPENLLVDERGNIKITDFGLASLQPAPGSGAAGVGALLKTVCGTPNYVAPEVLREKGYSGPIADVWSCGVILFVMLAGYLPFDDPQLSALFAKIERGEYRMCRHFSDGAKDLIQRMLATDPSKRPTLEQVCRHPWFAKGWDRSVFDAFNDATVAPDSDDSSSGGLSNGVNLAATTVGTPAGTSVRGWAGSVEKEVVNNVVATAGGGAASAHALGAFELITQLAMNTITQMTSSRPVFKVFTRFIVGANLRGAHEAAIAVLQQLDASPKTKETNGDQAREDGDVCEIKGFQQRPKGLLTYVVSLYSLVEPSLTMAEVRRGRGDTFDFHDLYHKIVAGLGALVRSKSVVANGEPAAVAAASGAVVAAAPPALQA